jgi:phosphoribosylaminoimidazole-succinocarboxamide synthase
MKAIKETHFSLPDQTSFYKGKVRDVYGISNKLMVMVVSDRISAFDVVLPRAIPYKGQVLNQIAAKALKQTEDIIANWLIDVPDPNVSIGLICEPFKLEMVIRGYLCGHVWREYKAGNRVICGENLPDGLKENDQLPEPIITPTTKASVGHDENVSRDEIIERQIANQEDYLKLEEYAKALFQRGTEVAAEKGLILADTKYEFGKHGNRIVLKDEIHTPDSSRYFYSETYQALQDANQPQRQLSKEFVRIWLMENGFQGKEGQQVPDMTDELVESISERYIELFEHITGDKFVFPTENDTLMRIENNILKSLKKIK